MALTCNELTAISGGKVGLLSTKEAVARWGISKYALRELVNEGVITPVIIGSRNWKFDPNDYNRIIQFCKN